MKREIKFRAWDNDNELFSYFDFTDLIKLMEEIDSFESYFSKSYFNKVDEKTGNPLLMQFTGLTDKNGKEIYEGDIVKYQSFANWDDNTDSLKRHIGVVKFIDNHLHYPACYCIEMVIEGRNGGYHNLSKHEPLHKTCATWGLEIIGNVYENPNILSND